jgi:hypothetical protein
MKPVYTTRERRAATGALALAFTTFLAGAAALYFLAYAEPLNVEAGVSCVILTAVLLLLGAYRTLLTRAGVLALAALLLPAPAAAQDVMLSLDKGAIVGLGPEYTSPAELDGNPSTI